MDSLGIVVFKNGDLVPFGKPVYRDQDGYAKAPGHLDTFVNEIASSFDFKSGGFEFDIDNSYRSIIDLSKKGLIIILNNKVYTTDPNKTFGFVPSTLTSLQLETVKEMVDNKMFEGFIEELHEFIDDDDIKYNSLDEYYQSKKKREK